MNKPHKVFHLYQLMFIPILLVGALFVGVYGGLAWIAYWALKHLVRHIERTESNDSVKEEA